MLAGALCGALLLKSQVFVPLALAAVMALATWLVYVPAAVRLGSGRPGHVVAQQMVVLDGAPRGAS
jgi:hypothetical protein